MKWIFIRLFFSYYEVKIASVVDKPDSVVPPQGGISIIDLGRTLLYRL